MPVDYALFMGIGLLLVAFSFRIRRADGGEAAEAARNPAGDGR